MLGCQGSESGNNAKSAGNQSQAASPSTTTERTVVQLPRVGTWVGAHSIIVRPESLTESFVGIGNGTFYDNVDCLARRAIAAGVRAVYIEMRAVDPSDANLSQKGHLYFAAESHPDLIATNHFVSSLGENFGDGALMTYLVETLHRSGLLVFAWMPVFNDYVVWQDPQYRSEPVRASQINERGFVSTTNTTVKAHELAIIDQLLKKFRFDGINLDYLRYQIDEQPQEPSADTTFRSLYGTPIAVPAESGGDHPLWKNYLDFRAAALTSFASDAKNIANAQRDIEFGAFLMPHSVKTSANDGDTWGYYASPWSGVDFRKMTAVGMNLMPMVYWNNGWEDPYTRNEFNNRVLGNTNELAQLNPASTTIPVYSLHYPHEELINAFELAKRNDVADVSLFFWGDWCNGGAFDALDNALSKVNGDGAENTPNVDILEPRGSNAVVTIAADTPLRLNINITSPSKTPITDAYYRFDGGVYHAISLNVQPPDITDIDLSMLLPGGHTVTVLARDNTGRIGQDVIEINVTPDTF